jgi:hypothetical protein
VEEIVNTNKVTCDKWYAGFSSKDEELQRLHDGRTNQTALIHKQNSELGFMDVSLGFI